MAASSDQPPEVRTAETSASAFHFCRSPPYCPGPSTVTFWSKTTPRR